MAVDLGRGQAPLYPIYEREKYRIHVSCKEWGEETLYAARKGNKHRSILRGKRQELLDPVRKEGRESSYPVRKGDRNPCIL